MVTNYAVHRAVALITAAILLLVGIAPSVHAQERIYSYICMSAQDRLCLGLSTKTKPVYNAGSLIHLQVKVRDKVEQQGLDYLKTRWSVFANSGRIQLANFTSLCVAKEIPFGPSPGEVVLRPCGTQGDLEVFDLDNFFTKRFEDSTLRLKAFPEQCLTLMKCDKSKVNYCSPFTTTPFTGTTMDPALLRGAYVKFMPCEANLTSQMFTQTIDCAPGCSPFMMEGPDNTCDQACANEACNWDNRACATPNPTPPTFSPSAVPTVRPTSSPSHAPSTSKPTRDPTTSGPSKHPTPAPTPSQPTTKAPVLRTPVPSSAPTYAPSSSPTPHNGPINVGGEGDTQAPTGSPSLTTFSPTTASPTVQRANSGASTSTDVGQSLWWVWLIICIVVVLLLLLCIFCLIIPMVKKNRKEKEDAEKAREAEKLADVEVATIDSGAAAGGATAASAGTVDVLVQTVTSGDDLAIENGPATTDAGDDLAIENGPATTDTGDDLAIENGPATETGFQDAQAPADVAQQ